MPKCQSNFISVILLDLEYCSSFDNIQNFRTSIRSSSLSVSGTNKFQDTIVVHTAAALRASRDRLTDSREWNSRNFVARSRPSGHNRRLDWSDRAEFVAVDPHRKYLTERMNSLCMVTDSANARCLERQIEEEILI